MKGYENMVIQKGDEVFYQTNNENAWLGPVEVTDVDDNYVFLKLIVIEGRCLSVMQS